MTSEIEGGLRAKSDCKIPVGEKCGGRHKATECIIVDYTVKSSVLPQLDALYYEQNNPDVTPGSLWVLQNQTT